MNFRRCAVALISPLALHAQSQGPTGGEFWTIKIGDIIMILAVVAAPLVAVHIQWRLQLRREKRDRKVWIFKTLMATRGTPIAVEHVQALNMIDVEFDGKSGKDAAIREAWKVYLDHLNKPFDWAKADDVQKGLQNEKTGDLLAELMQKMGEPLGYHFDVVYLKKHVYVPIGHGELQLEERIMRRAWIRVITGQNPLKMEIVSLPAMASEKELEEQAKLRTASLDFFEKKEPWPVRIVDQTPPGEPRS